MLSPRLTNCPECANIPSLLKKIDCKLAELGNNLYNNISYMLNKPVPSSDILQLIGYRRILMYKYCNPSYVEKYSVQMIASRVIRLTAGCVSKCNELERCLEEPCDIKIVPNPSTTSTSTLPITTTTSTSSTSSTTTTSTTAVPTTTTTSSSSTSTTTSTSSSTSTTTSTTSTTSTSSSTTTTTTTLEPTTTTTTTIEPLRYFYNATFYNCGDCVTPSGAGSFNNSQPLTAGMYYINSSGIIIYINSFNSVTPGISTNNILDSSQQVNCGDIVCPTTTTTTTIEPTTTTTTTAMVLPSVTVCGRTITNENSTLTVLSDGTPIPYASNITEWNDYITNGTPCYTYWEFNPAEAYRGCLYNQAAINNLPPPGWRGLTTTDVQYFYDCNPYLPVENLYAANPGNWDPTFWTDQSNAGETGIDFQGYGSPLWNAGNILWNYDGRFESHGYSPSTFPSYGCSVNTSNAGGYVSWGDYLGYTINDPLYARFIKL